MKHHRLRFELDGRVGFEGAPEGRPLTAPGEYDAHEGPSGVWLLSPQAAPDVGRWRILMMGEIITRTTVLEVVNMITSSNWRGELHVAGEKGTRVLTLDQGALKHAKTNFESERIGQLLVRAGLLSRGDLGRMLPEKPSDKRFGQLLVERGLLNQEALFKHIQQQAEAIFYATLLEDSGMYWLVAPPESAPPPSTTLHLPLQNLLMEGVQRIDEMALYRERIPHNHVFPIQSTEARSGPAAAPDEAAGAVLALCDGTRNIDDLARATGLTEFPTLKIVYGLLRAGQVRLRSGPSLDSDTATRLVRQFNDIVRDIFLAVATYSSMERAQTALSRWLSDSAHRAVLGPNVEVDGTLSPDAVLAHIGESAIDDPMSALHNALHELAAYALFIAGSSLPRNEEEALVRDVNHRLKQLKL